MANNGVNVIENHAGRIQIFDPVTTDQSSAEFREINVMAQKDNVVKQVRKQLDNTVVGIVPDDLAQFIFEVKSQIATQLRSAIASYSSPEGLFWAKLSAASARRLRAWS